MKNKFDSSKYIMIPYKNKGRSFDGCDCWGLIYLIYLNEFGINLPLLSEKYSDASEGKQIADTIRKNKPLINNIQKETPDYGDVVVFNIKGYTSHVGIYIGRNKVLHILKNINSGIERLDSFRLKGRVEGYYEIL
jgi:cell wall-associated NlpC family hydrolase